MSSTTATLDETYTEADAVDVLANIASVVLPMGEFDRAEAVSDVRRLRESPESTFGFSPEFRKWESRLMAHTGAWWQIDDLSGTITFTVHY